MLSAGSPAEGSPLQEETFAGSERGLARGSEEPEGESAVGVVCVRLASLPLLFVPHTAATFFAFRLTFVLCHLGCTFICKEKS